MTKEELERQTEELARQLQHAIDQWDDPDRVAAREAHLREKEDHQRAVFEESYLRTGQRKPDDSLEETIGKITRFFAQRIERGEERVQPLPVLPSGEDVSLAVKTIDGKRYVLELIVEKGAQVAKQILVHGPVAQVLALLRTPQSPEYIVLFTDKLRRQLETTFEDALAKGGTLVAAWDDVDVDDSALVLFAVSPEGAWRLVGTTVDPKHHEDKADELRARGVRIGLTCSNSPFVWVADDSALTVWSDTGIVIEGDRTSLQLASSRVSPGDASRVVSFYDEQDRGHRGVRLVLGNGSQAVVLEEHDDTVKNRKSYSDDDLFEDALWASSFGGDLALWLDLPHDDDIAGVGNVDTLRIATVSRELAALVERAPAAGPFEHVIRSLGAIAPAGEVAYRFAPDPVEPERRFLELRVSTPSGKSTAGRWIRQGSNAQIAAFLRGVRAPTTVLRTTTSLLQGLNQDGYA